MPFLAVAIVLATMLLGGGLGARGSAGSSRSVALAGALMFLTTLAWASKLALDWPPPGLLAGSLTLAALGGGFGYLSGSFFPCGLRSFAGLDAPHRRAQAFALSSAFSVAGAAAGPVIAIVWGTRALLGVGALCLFGAAALLLASSSRASPRPRPGQTVTNSSSSE